MHGQGFESMPGSVLEVPAPPPSPSQDSRSSRTTQLDAEEAACLPAFGFLSPYTSLHIYFRQIRLSTVRESHAYAAAGAGILQAALRFKRWRCSYAPSTRTTSSPKNPEARTPETLKPQPLSMRKHENDNRQFIEARTHTHTHRGHWQDQGRTHRHSRWSLKSRQHNGAEKCLERKRMRMRMPMIIMICWFPATASFAFSFSSAR